MADGLADVVGEVDGRDGLAPGWRAYSASALLVGGTVPSGRIAM
ncbi:hypothetical protein [Streptomyces sp. NPDC048612]